MYFLLNLGLVINMKKTAIVLGATGLVGGLLLKRLLEDENYETIKLFSRKKLPIKSPNIVEFIGDILELENFKNDFLADEVFCCIGTTAKKTKDKETYEKIDCGIPSKASHLAKLNGIETFLVISAIGANPKSSIFYNQTKGKMEENVLNQNIKNTYILRPSLIYGKRDEKRFLEDIGNKIFDFLSPFMIGFLQKYKPIKASTIANAMHTIAQKKPNKNIITSDEITKITTT